MTDIEVREKKTRLIQLSPEERASIAHLCAIGYAEGETYASLARAHNIPTSAVKTLLQEHAAYIRNARPETRSIQEEEYRRFYGEMKKIRPDDSDYPALVRAKAVEARIQILTRLDKLLGHEVQGDVEGAVNSIADLARKMHQRGDFDGVSPMDIARLADEEDNIVDAEVIEEDDDREQE